MNKSIFALCCWLSLVGLTSPALARVELVNTQHFNLTNITSVTVSYVSESVQIIPGMGPNLILREYLSRDRRSYFAKIEQNGSELSIACGNRPWFRSLSGKIVLEIPVSYLGALEVGSISGNIDLQSGLNLNQLLVRTTSGTISLDSLIAADLQVTSVSGKIELRNIFAQMTLSSVSGEIEIAACRGPVAAASTSGKLSLHLDELLGDLDLRSVSGKIELHLPESSIYQLKAETTSGDIRLDLDAPWIIREGGSAMASFGFEEAGLRQIDLRTTSGAIHVGH